MSEPSSLSLFATNYSLRQVSGSSPILCENVSTSSEWLQYRASQSMLLSKQQWLTEEEIDRLPLAILEKQQLIPNASKFRLMLCETFVATGSCPFHNEKRNLCAFAHDKRIKYSPTLQNSKKNKLKKDININLNEGILVSTAKTQSLCLTSQGSPFPIHWPNRQKPVNPQSILSDISPLIRYDEPEMIRAFKKPLIKRCVFYLWDSFLDVFTNNQNQGNISFGLPNKFVEDTEALVSFHERKLKYSKRPRYYTRRLPIFVGILSNDN